MTDISLSVGDIIIDAISKGRYRVIWIKDDIGNLCKMDISSLQIITVPTQEIIAELMRGKLELSKEPGHVINTSEMSDALRQKYELYSSIFTDIDAAFGPDYTRLSGRAYKPELEKMIAKYGLVRSTMWKIIRIYLQSGRDISHIFANMYPRTRNIKPGGKKRGRKSFVGIPLDAEVISHFEYALELYKSGRAMTIRAAFTLMNIKYYSKEGGNEISTNLLLPASERPTYKQLYNYIRKRTTKEALDIIKTSKQEQRNNKRLLLSSSLDGVNGPGDLAEIDAVEIDVSLVSSILPDQAIGRPIAYVMIDVYTRAILAISVAFDNNSNVGLTSLFMNLAEDKVAFCKKYGLEIAASSWPSNCIPARIRVDRGSDFKSKDFEEICRRLNIQREIVPGGSGSLKGVVEQFFHQMHSAQNPILENRGLITKRYDSKHHKESTMVIDEYIPLFIAIILKHNMQFMEGYRLTADMRKEGVTATPLSIWEYGIKKYGLPRPITNTQQYLYDLMIERHASLSRKGILFDGLYYLNSGDPKLFSEMQKVGAKRITFPIRYDPRSVNNVYYLRDNKLMAAPLNQIRGNIEYANLSFAEWDVLRKDEADLKKLGREYNDQLDADLMSIGQTIAIAASGKKSRYSNTKNISKARALEKHQVTQANRIALQPTADQLEQASPAAPVPEEKPVSNIAVEIPANDSFEDFQKALKDFNEED